MQRHRPTKSEALLLARGEISDGAHMAGVITSVFPGFGIGQAVQGRWADAGGLITIGSVLFLLLALAGAAQGAGSGLSGGDDGGGTLAAIGAVGFGAVHIWGIVDAITGPPRHNQRVRELRQRHGLSIPVQGRVLPYVNTTRDGGGVAGVTFRF